MKNRGKSIRRTVASSPYKQPLGPSSTGRLKIKFDFTQSNLSCFMDQKRFSKGLNMKRSLSRLKGRKFSCQKKKPTHSRNKIQSQIIPSTKERERAQNSPDILRQASNSVLSQIQDQGIQYEWKDNEAHSQDNLKVSNVEDEEELNKSKQIWSVFSVASRSKNSNSIEKSYASTMDYQTHNNSTYYTPNHSVHMPLHINHSQHQYINSNDDSEASMFVEYKQRFSPIQANSFEVRVQNIGYDTRTTLMIRNIPNKYTIKDLSQQIDYGFDNMYDFLYLPCDLKNNCNVGYGFINFVKTDGMREFYQLFHNQKWSKFRSQKICVLTYARLQGLNSLIEHFQNSKVLNQKEKRFRPIIKHQQNTRIDCLIKSQQQR